MVTQSVSTQPSYIKPATKERWAKADLLTYVNTIGLLLHSVNIPTHMFTCAAGCTISTIIMILLAISLLIIWVGQVVLVFLEFLVNASSRFDLMNWTGSKRLVFIRIVYGVGVSSHYLTLSTLPDYRLNIIISALLSKLLLTMERTMLMKYRTIS